MAFATFAKLLLTRSDAQTPVLLISALAFPLLRTPEKSTLLSQMTGLPRVPSASNLWQSGMKSPSPKSTWSGDQANRKPNLRLSGGFSSICLLIMIFILVSHGFASANVHHPHNLFPSQFLSLPLEIEPCANEAYAKAIALSV